ncbi:hypothetical protein [Sulfitobacter sp. UBA4523]|jgi:hypothetical protein|uniref:hypothetical protein n=1 Tax=Sulfitobacter sp. UBA4523 TaxID=1947584 RepID=UPI00257A8CE7|nr:hypothetical protein [Sulfitobacter sp. UBA4523]
MPEWFSAFLKSIDKEVMTLLAVGVATFLSTCVMAMRGYKRGKPSSAATAQAIAQISCGAPQLQGKIEHISQVQLEEILHLRDIDAKLDRVAEQVTRIEDRTRNR